MKPQNPNFGPVYHERPHSSGPSQSLAEKELLARARAGDQAAFGELCKRSEPRLLRMARHIVRNEEDAQDAVQEALLNAFLNLSRFDERSSFFTWATRIAINSSLMQLRKRRRFFLRSIDDAPEDLALKDPAPDPEALLAQKDEQRVLHEAIRSLPRTLRIVVELKQFRDCSLEETAAALSISSPAAKARFFRAKEPSKTALSEPCDAAPCFAPKSLQFHALRDLLAVKFAVPIREHDSSLFAVPGLMQQFPRRFSRICGRSGSYWRAREPSPCLLRGNIREIVALPGEAELSLTALSECAAIAGACGYPPSPSFLAEKSAQQTTAGSRLASAMYRDLKKGAPVEANTILGDLIEHGQKYNVAAPILQAAFASLSIYQRGLAHAKAAGT